MKLLLIWDTIQDYELFLTQLDSYQESSEESLRSAINNPSDSIVRLHFIMYEGIQIHSLIAGHTSDEVAFFVGRVLQCMKFHLAIQLSTAFDLKLTGKESSMVSVINDKLWVQEKSSKEEQLQLIEDNSWPQQMGGFVNMTNAYFNVFLEIPKVASKTIQFDSLRQMTDFEHMSLLLKIHVLSNNGWGFHYSCLYFRQPFYQIRFLRSLSSYNSTNSRKLLKNEMNTTIQLIKLIS